MPIVFALLVAPILALVDQGVALSITTWTCRGQHALAPHALQAAFALAVAVATWLAWRRWRATAKGAGASEKNALSHSFAAMAVAVSAFSLLAILAMWFPTWVLSSCLQ